MDSLKFIKNIENIRYILQLKKIFDYHLFIGLNMKKLIKAINA